MPACPLPPCLWPWPGSACQRRQSLLPHSIGHSSATFFNDCFSPVTLLYGSGGQLAVMLRACPHSSTHSGKRCPPGRGGEAGRNPPVWGLIQGNQKCQAFGTVLSITSPATGRLEQLHEEGLTTAVATHPALTGIPRASQQAPLVATLLALSSRQEETPRKTAWRNLLQSGCHLSCLWVPCNNRFSSSSPL